MSFGAKRPRFPALHQRNFRLYWIGQVVSLIGVWMQQVSLPLLVLTLGGNATDVGAVAGLQFGPTAVLAPLGGAFGDRFDRQRVLLVAYLGLSLQAAILLVTTATGTITMPVVLGLALMLGVFNAAEMPVRHAFTADLVSKEDLASAIALNQVAFNAARVIGPGLAGLILGAAAATNLSLMQGFVAVFGLSLMTFSAVLAAVSRVDRAAVRGSTRVATGTTLSSLRAGAAYAVQEPLILWPLVLLGGVAGLANNFLVLLPVLIDQSPSVEPEAYGALFVALGLGSLAASLRIAVVRGSIATLMIMPALGLAACEIGLGLTSSPSIWIAIVICAGYSNMKMVTAISSILQLNTKGHLRGRVMALYVAVFAATAPVGSVVIGSLADAVSASAASIVLGLSSAGVTCLVGWRLRPYLHRNT